MDEKESQLEAAIDELRCRMEKAVSAENFEEAAMLRDEIRSMNEKREKENQP
jgi:protein-arginine kinase activator protein McsA